MNISKFELLWDGKMVEYGIGDTYYRYCLDNIPVSFTVLWVRIIIGDYEIYFEPLSSGFYTL